MASVDLLGAGRKRDHHIRIDRPEGIVGEAGDRDNLLAVGKPDAGRDLRAAGPGAEIEIAYVRLRVLLVEDVDALHIIILRHRAFDAYRHRNGVAVLDQRRDVEPDLADAQARLADNV